MAVPKAWDGKKIGEINIRRKYHLNILGVKDPRMNMNITNDTVLYYGQNMLVLGRYENVQKIFAL